VLLAPITLAVAPAFPRHAASFLHHEITMYTITYLHAPDWYVVAYDDDTKAEALRVIGRWASNPNLNFTWYDAALMSQRIRENKTDARFRQWRQAS